MSLTDEIRNEIENIKELKITVGDINNHLSVLEGLTRKDIEEREKEAFQRGYDDGYEAGCAIAFKPVSDSEYQRGLEDAWDAARKIALMDTETSEKVTGYFGLFRIMENLTSMQAIEKLKAYEESKNKIHVGDIVYFKGKPEIKACVTAINESGMETTFSGIAITNVETYCSVGNPYISCRVDDWCKTGEHFNIEPLWKGESWFPRLTS